MSSPKLKNISLFQKCKSGYIACIPSRPEGRSRSSRTWDGDAVDAKAATDERGRGVRKRRVVLTPRCWRQCSWRQQLSGRYGGKRAVLRGEHVISRKAIAQGRSDALRWTCMLVCALFVHIAHETAGAARTRSSLRPLFGEGKDFSHSSGAMHRENAKLYLPSLRAQRSNPCGEEKRMDCFVAFAPRNDGQAIEDRNSQQLRSAIRATAKQKRGRSPRRV